MKTIRTVVCKLAPTSEQASAIDATLVAFALACDFAAESARRIGSTNKVKVQHEAYRTIRERFRLSANLAIRAIARACAALKVPAKIQSRFAPTSIDYDARIFAFHEGNWTFGLTLLTGRHETATTVGDYQKSLLKGRKPTAPVLVKRRDGSLGLPLSVQACASRRVAAPCGACAGPRSKAGARGSRPTPSEHGSPLAEIVMANRRKWVVS
jgi:hypothetical protein